MQKSCMLILLSFLLTHTLYMTTSTSEPYDYFLNYGINNTKDEQLIRTLHFLKKQETIHLPTWSKSYHLLPQIITEYGYKIGCEIGVAFATHSKAILEKSNVNVLYSIDPYLHFPMEKYDDCMNLDQRDFDVLFSIVTYRLKPFGNRSIVMRKTSLEAAKNFKKHELDFIYLDANHSYESVKAELEAWYDLVKPGGLISGDDYGHAQFPGVKKAVDEFFLQKNLIVYTSTEVKEFFWIIKPK